MTRHISEADRNQIADFIREEFTRRKENKRRKSLEKQWKEVDRQIALDPKPNVPRDGEKVDRNWFSAVELPLQATALEVLSADAVSIIFPRGEEWYRAHALLTDDYMERANKLSFLAGDKQNIPTGGMNQDTADIVVKSVLDSFHAQYRFRHAWAQMIGEGLKYGTYSGRVMLNKMAVLTNDYRGAFVGERKIPVLIPVSIRNLYIDDSVQHALHEGMVVRPSQIRRYWQKLVDLKQAAKNGNGWSRTALNGLEVSAVDEKSGSIEILEYEGDLWVPRSQGKDIFVSNWVWKVAVSENAKVIFERELDQPFRSYLIDVYQADDIDSPYGSSPLMKGRPLQEAATEIANRMLNASALNAEPPIVYDGSDADLIAEGGPQIHPGAQIKSDSPKLVIPLKIGEPAALFANMAGMRQFHEDVTKVNDPRRGGATKSHTTATAKQIESERGIVTTDHFAQGVESGPVLSWLYMHYELTKEALDREMIVFANTRGVMGHMRVTRAHLPDQADFTVEGSRGMFTKAERRQNFMEFYKVMIDTLPLRAQIGAPLPNLEELDLELAAQLGVTDAARFIGERANPTETDEGQSGIPDAVGEVPEGDQTAALPEG